MYVVPQNYSTLVDRSASHIVIDMLPSKACGLDMGSGVGDEVRPSGGPAADEK